MGNSFAKLVNWKTKSKQLVAFGVIELGNTVQTISLLNKLAADASNELITSTIGYYLEMVIDKKKSSVFTSNIADQIESCKFWKKYFVNKQTVIFVFDINDNCLNKARLLLHKFVTDLEKYTSFAHLLIIGIKKDRSLFVYENDLFEDMEFNEISSIFNWHFQLVNLFTEDGFYKCIDWVAGRLKNEMK